MQLLYTLPKEPKGRKKQRSSKLCDRACHGMIRQLKLRRMERKDWPLWEVFIRSKAGLSHKHAGSLHAPDEEMAVSNARDVYTRRSEGISIWVVESKHIHATQGNDSEAMFDPSEDKVYRHPTFYDIPDEVGHM
jgi:ring-1,2-phenylacetyl-CoA epoxidase subunit PaaB